MTTPDAVKYKSPPRVSLSPGDDVALKISPNKVRWAHLKKELSKLGMIAGQDALKQSGLAPGHGHILCDLAKNFNTIVAIRPVNHHATQLIASMAVVKGLDDTHLKSASTGPMAGFIPIDPRLGKSGQTLLENKNADTNPTFEIDSTKPGVVASPLTITENRRNELFVKGVMTQSQNGLVLCGGEQPSDFDKALNSNFEFRLNDLSNGNFSVQYKNRTSTENNASSWKNVDVVAKYIGPDQPALPMTADYDVLGYFPHIGNFKKGTFPSKASEISLRDLLQRRKENEITPTQFKSKLIQAVTQKVQQEMLGQNDRRDPSPSKGSFTITEDFISKELNKALRPEVYDANGQVKPNSAGPLIHHGPEVNNPHPENDAQITIFGPNKTIYTTKSQEQMNQVLHLLRSSGYLVYPNQKRESTKTENELIKAGKPWKSGGPKNTSGINSPPTLQRTPDSLDSTGFNPENLSDRFNKVRKLAKDDE